MEEREAESAKKRMLAGKKQPSGNFPQGTGKSRDKVAIFTGSSARTMKKISEVCKAAEAEPEKYQPLVDEMDKTGRVNGVHKKLKTAQQAEKLRAEPAKPPDGKYRVLVIDPPWSYGRSDDPTHMSANPYPSMSIESIHSLPIGEWAHGDSVLWLWTTNAFMRDSFTCLDAWGFQQKTILTWIKPRIGSRDVVLVQVKTRDWPGSVEMETLREFTAPPMARKLVHHWRNRQRLPDLREL